ncbi:hypothetical protein BST61_g10301 [Cercospora zeina]
MGALRDEHGDPKAWASCLLCGIAAMDEDELEAEKVKKMRLEREARWKAEKAADGPSAPQLPTAAAITGTVNAAEETELHTAEEIRPIVMNQPQRTEPMTARPPSPPKIIVTAPTIVGDFTGTRNPTPVQRTQTPSSRPTTAAPDNPRSSFVPKPSPPRHDAFDPVATPTSKARQPGGSSCPLCDSNDHAEDRCPRLEGISISPTKGMARASIVR